MTNSSPNKFFRSKARKEYLRNIKQAESERKDLMQQYEDYELKAVQNPYSQMSLRTEAMELQQQGLAQQQADILAGLQGAAGGAGIASLGQGLARQAAKAQSEVAGQMAQQENQLKMMEAQAQMRIEEAQQQFDLGRMETMLGMSMEREAAIREGELARRGQNKALFGNIVSSLIGGGSDVAAAYVGKPS